MTGNSNISSADISSTQYAQRTRHLIKLINELRGVGAPANIDLPRIAVIGNQSAGKSSLVEAISGRASGTCTRCPMECRLTNSTSPWKCQVLLRFEKDETGQPISEVREVKFGPLLTDKSKLEEMLRCAQLVILNPSVPHTSFVDFDTSAIVPGEPLLGDKKSLQFSSNVVPLDLSGPDSADLSFIDLPGIISNVAEGEDRNNIKLVQDLVNDLENQSAAFMAVRADTIQSGEESTWMDVLRGRRHVLKRGYYVTKQPGPDELTKKVSFEDSRRNEQDFFAKTEPWKSSTVEVKSRIGIPRLTAELSRLLNARQALNDMLKDLESLPPPLPENPVVELLWLLTAFSTELKHWVDGSERHEGLVQIFKDASVEFKQNILRTAPNLQPFKDAKEEEALGHPCRSPRKHGVRTSVDPTCDDASTLDADLSSPPMFLLDVREYVLKSLGRELPYNVPFSSKRGLIERSFTTWDQDAMAFFEIICQAATKQVFEKQISRMHKDTRDHITWFLELEKPPYTQNNQYLSSLRNKFLSKYAAARNVKRVNSGEVQKRSFTQSPSYALSVLAALGFEGLSVDDLQKLNTTDQFEEELTVMAERIIDDLPHMVDHDFLQPLGKHIQGALVGEFGIGSEKATERANIYLEEDPSVVAKREELKAKVERLNEVLTKLFNFGL
ncbi:P-loop containing nucleoside triphosphate hydrolase protein [Gautieria morchelliformis]|nr:P-loop containing nucleoside triphosphate hydrolase protein [Gautieria morchelliformis]